tara:strand:+ start:1008 stop:1280 length:273 start_codon:yes stop_codon:yes gene_type:complete
MANNLTVDVTTGEITSTPETSEEISNRESKLEEWQPVNVREERNTKLSATDWTASTDITMTAEMTAYRKALRDVPAQAGFPNTITWPEAP